jgi:clathrin heavy chain
MTLLEAGLGLERAHTGMFTELSILYSKHKPERLMDYLHLFHSRIKRYQAVPVFKAAYLWQEIVFLYVHVDEFDKAATTIMDHPAEAWEHKQFKDLISKVYIVV